MSDTSLTAPAIPTDVMEQLADIKCEMSSENIVGYVSRQINDLTEENLAEARADEQQAEEVAKEANKEAARIVKADAESRTAKKIKATLDGLKKFGLNPTYIVRIDLERTRERPDEDDEEDRGKVVYAKYSCTVVVEAVAGDDDLDVRFSLTQHYAYPARAKAQLEKRDAANAAKNAANERQLQLRTTESKAVAECRKSVDSFIVEQRVRAMGAGGDNIVQFLDSLVGDVVTRVTRRAGIDAPTKPKKRKKKRLTNR